MAITDEVVEQRFGYIGSSDAASVCGIPSAFSTPYGVFVEKVWRLRGNIEEIMEIGNLMEPVIAELYRRRTGLTVSDHPTIFHKERSWQAANLDRVAGAAATTRRIVELKNAVMARDWGPAGSNVVPSHYYIQGQHQMVVAASSGEAIDGDVLDIAVLIGGHDFRIFEIQHSKKITDRVSDLESEFWDRVMRRDPPEPDFTHRHTLDLMKIVHTDVDEKAKKVLGDAEASMIDMIKRCNDMNKMKSQAEKAVKELKARILHDMGHYSEYSLPGGMIVRRQKVRTRNGGSVRLTIKGVNDGSDNTGEDE